MADDNPPTPPPAPGDDSPRERGEINQEHIDELNSAEHIVRTADKPDYGPRFDEVALAGPYRAEALERIGEARKLIWPPRSVPGRPPRKTSPRPRRNAGIPSSRCSAWCRATPSRSTSGAIPACCVTTTSA
jgi:hypothetical protein